MMTRPRPIGFWIAAATGSLGLVACLASVFVDSPLSLTLLSLGGLLVLPAAIGLASIMSGRPVNDPADSVPTKKQPILDGVLALGFGLFELARVLWPDSSSAHSAWWRAAIGALAALGIGLGVFRLVRAIVARWKMRSITG